ncbi:MAG: DUF2335 domain-containing protein [Candidatus Acidiferrales bacterium]
MGKHSKQLRLARQSQQLGSTGNFQIMAQAAHFSGPIPPPEILAKYNDAIPGGAERIVAMAESQSLHRQSLEKAVIEANCRVQKTGPIYGFIICMTAILGGIYLVHSGKSAEGLASIITALSSVAVVFVVGKKKQEKELKDKASALVPHQQS